MANASWLKPSKVSSVNSLFILRRSLYNWIEFWIKYQLNERTKNKKNRKIKCKRWGVQFLEAVTQCGFPFGQHTM
jgi:hypothetical protein